MTLYSCEHSASKHRWCFLSILMHTYGKITYRKYVTQIFTIFYYSFITRRKSNFFILHSNVVYLYLWEGYKINLYFTYVEICGNKMPTRCNRGFYCRSYCLLNMLRTPLYSCEHSASKHGWCFLSILIYTCGKTTYRKYVTQIFTILGTYSFITRRKSNFFTLHSNVVYLYLWEDYEINLFFTCWWKDLNCTVIIIIIIVIIYRED